jgi:large subunit ribosomal protein L25
MHEKAPLLSAKKRERLGTRYCDRIRKSGGLPAVVYGHGSQPVPILLNAHEAVSHITAGEKVFRMELVDGADGFKDQIVLLKELQFDYLGTNPVHADFARVDLSERVKTRVLVHLVGEAKGLKQAGAILMHPQTEVEIECRVMDLPDFVEVRIDELDVGHAITAADLKLAADVKMITDKHAILAQIVIQQEIVVGEATAAEGEAGEPEVITAKKPAEGEAGAAAAPGAKPAAGAKGAAPAAGAKPAAGAPAAGAKPAAGAAPAKGGDKKK